MRLFVGGLLLLLLAFFVHIVDDTDDAIFLFIAHKDLAHSVFTGPLTSTAECTSTSFIPPRRRSNRRRWPLR